MELKISSQFASDFKNAGDNSLHRKVKSVFEMLKKANSINEITQFRKINGSSNSYKMGIGFYYMVGIITSENQLTLMRFLHRDMLMKVLDQK